MAAYHLKIQADAYNPGTESWLRSHTTTATVRAVSRKHALNKAIANAPKYLGVLHDWNHTDNDHLQVEVTATLLEKSTRRAILLDEGV